MNAVGGDTAGIAGDHGFDRWKGVDRYGRHDDARNAGGQRRRMHCIAIRRKLGRIEMTVGVDQHRMKGKSGAAR